MGNSDSLRPSRYSLIIVAEANESLYAKNHYCAETVVSFGLYFDLRYILERGQFKCNVQSLAINTVKEKHKVHSHSQPRIAKSFIISFLFAHPLLISDGFASNLLRRQHTTTRLLLFDSITICRGPWVLNNLLNSDPV